MTPCSPYLMVAAPQKAQIDNDRNRELPPADNLCNFGDPACLFDKGIVIPPAHTAVCTFCKANKFLPYYSLCGEKTQLQSLKGLQDKNIPKAILLNYEKHV